ncbi:MAG: tRNA1(Val) (adenine(37)-N6)-methyltransferase [Eubacteriales bacterium]|nr:tRNA1(Val) (adenine(37)-N6)-methyltransferase [Eubacteriales bacterium]
MEALLRDGERIDNIGFGDLRLIQKPGNFCYGIDAVLLATFAEVIKYGKVIDLGAGTGVIPLILSHRTEAAEIVGVEVQKDSYERGLRNVALNNLGDRVILIHGDIKELAEKKLAGKHSFDAVITNPPYIKDGGGIKNKEEARTIARHETTAKLSDFISVASFLLKERGDFYMIHRPSRLVDISILCRRYNLEPKKLRLVSPNRDTAPNLLLIHCVKYGMPELKFLAPLYVYQEDGSYTSEIMNLYEK